jgi:hypothetical protein
MVEAANVDPGSGAMARFAAQGSPVGALLRHAILEFALMGIGVTGSASLVREMERENLVGPAAESCFVAIGTSDGHMRPGQHKAGVFVLGNRECRAVKVFYGMAILAAVLIGIRGKLFVVRILMAIHTRREFHFIQGVFTCRHVAFIAGDGRMFSFERVLRRSVFLYTEVRRLPAFNGMTLRTFSFARSPLELPPLWHSLQLTFKCIPTSGYFVFEWSNCIDAFTFFQLAVV